MGTTVTYCGSQGRPSHGIRCTGSDEGRSPPCRVQPTAGRGYLSDTALQIQSYRLNSVYRWHTPARDR